jgi:hypothetical protein
VSRSVKVGLSEFALVALRGDERDGGIRAQEQMACAVRYYLSDRDPERPGWLYPAFLREREQGSTVEFEFSIDKDDWRSFKGEAKRQDVSVMRLAEHAALYFVAELNAGRARKT